MIYDICIIFSFELEVIEIVYFVEIVIFCIKFNYDCCVEEIDIC